jgi:hypothetical protein
MLVHQLLVVAILMCVVVASAKSGGSKTKEKPKKEKQYWEDFTTEGTPTPSFQNVAHDCQH